MANCSSSHKSRKESIIPEAENLPGAVISRRERRRRLFSGGQAWDKEEDYGRRGSEEPPETDDEEEDEDDEDDAVEDQNERNREMIQMDEPSWMTVTQYRRQWNNLWSGSYGSFEDTTKVPSMRFTDKPAPGYGAFPLETVQVFSVKLAATRGRSLQQPLDVYGMVAIRDPIDHVRNIIFQRTRDDCQTLTILQDPYLELTGPSRAVMSVVSCPVIIEADLKVKAATDSEDDQCLAFLVMPVVCLSMMYSRMLNYAYTTESSTLEFKLGHMNSSVEATIFVRVVHGSWPDGLRGVFAAFCTGIYDGHTFLTKRVTGVGHERILLLDSRGYGRRLPVAGDGHVRLSRRMVSAEAAGQVIVRVKALEEGDGKKGVEREARFEALEDGRSVGV